MEKIHALVHKLNNPDAGILLLRLALGIVFIYHGWAKIQGAEGMIPFFESLGFNAFWFYVASYTEFLGGIALILGLFVRYAGILLTITMAVAVVTVHWDMGFSLQQGGYEYAFALMLASAALVATGAGKYSFTKKVPMVCTDCN
ncbi:hypothetical protein A3C89_03055 [Candidatus Kaiserbacteria bacterium RIFCSPHIGHO2_02_FULL_50_50]|uniref:DoxX family protein n=1 Tax=Candidatus Kaiserbacteria bacterium RIFCSPHIGHO2_02_FULL_50_50 TaxID=1798492 RepID=A0A1F6DDA3_9BACT|nr:MAG: hypothetical protein A3C89_03055 [Candidatus Kaiserbacteria bacterium RIFCSPHIGHO2_02_FULL_50_50]OGG88436.1 MAG: hypothetical protein A3G62_01700 [Candidatus Kaiserbacteria bacterium RIFCSPLOWO2_12_FULL_50_10]